MAAVSPVPQGMHTVTPNLIFQDCAKAPSSSTRRRSAGGALALPGAGRSSIWHSELRIGDAILYLNDVMPGMPMSAPTVDALSPVSIWLYLKDCDAAFHRAVGAGAKPTMPPADTFWGDRLAQVADPYGYIRNFATRQKELSP